MIATSLNSGISVYCSFIINLIVGKHHITLKVSLYVLKLKKMAYLPNTLILFIAMKLVFNAGSTP